VTLYALAGIENRKLSPPVFTAYTLGIVSGVATQAGATAKDVYVKMDIPLDHALSLDVHGPTPTRAALTTWMARSGCATVTRATSRSPSPPPARRCPPRRPSASWGCRPW